MSSFDECKSLNVRSARVCNLSVVGQLTDGEGNNLIPNPPPPPAPQPREVFLAMGGNEDGAVTDTANTYSFLEREETYWDEEINMTLTLNPSDFEEVFIYSYPADLQSVQVVAAINNIQSSSSEDYGDIQMEVFIVPNTVIPGNSPSFSVGDIPSTFPGALVTFELTKTFDTPLPAMTPFVIGLRKTGTTDFVSENFTVRALTVPGQ